RRHRRTRARVEEDLVGSQEPRSAAVHGDLDRLRPGEAGLAEDQRDVLRRLQLILTAGAEALDDRALALAHLSHVNAHGAVLDAVVGTAPGEVGDTSAGDHRLGWRTTEVDTGAADELTFEDCGLPACLRQRQTERLSALPGTDDDCVELLGR